MALFRLPEVADALDRLLEQERELILKGRLEALVRLGTEKIRLLEKLPTTQVDAETLERLRAKADRNQELLGAVIRGIRSVSQRLEALQNTQKELRTYDSGGHSQDLRRTKASFERKA